MNDPHSPPRGETFDTDTFDTFDTTETASAIRPLTLPDLIDGRYRILGRVGSGAMGVVLRGEDLFLRRPVAIKIVDPSVEPAIASRFVKEAQALALVRHENVVQVYAFGPFQRSSYLAMELVIGESLERIIDRYAEANSVVPLPRAVAILRAIGRGLEAVHARRLVHRDVKPANVIVEKGTDRPVLIDFGLARRRSPSNPKISITGGTPSYMAPEQAKDPNGTAVTARTDLYAFACTAFELFSGRPVFEGDDIYTILVAHMTEPPRRISTLRPELAPIDDVLSRALSKNPLDRFASVSEMLSALDVGLSRVRTSTNEGPRALVLASDAGLRRSLVRSTTNTLRTHGYSVRCETAESVTDATTLLQQHSFDVIVVDEESSEGRLLELITLARAQNFSTSIVVVSRDLPATSRSLGNTNVRHLVPKPVNVHVFGAVMGRIELVRQGRTSSLPP